MEKLIPLVNQIQDALGEFENYSGISFPRIVVVGSQSSGKSSVLESIVGKDFLPRGIGIVTRRPLILQLEKKSQGEDTGVFEHKPGVVFKDFNEIKKEIQSETIRSLGNKQSISEAPIKLKIQSPNLIDITLVDLPGLTKIAVGDQPFNISDLIRKMVIDYIKDDNTIILAISEATSDIATSESLKISREVDPKGERTIGVVTKIDLMDKGTDAVEMLLGKLYPLSLGYIGVICRSQLDINIGKSMQQHLEDERNFFESHDKYKFLSSKLGITYLAQTLNSVLKSHIKRILPRLKKELVDLVRNADLELKAYGMPVSGSDYQGVTILNIISTFCSLYTRVIEGRSVPTSYSDISGGAQLRHILFNKYLKQIEKIQIFEGFSDSEICTAISNSQGVRSDFLIPQEALENLIRFQISKFEQPSMEILQEVLDCLKKFVRDISIQEFAIYPNLQPCILNIVDEMLDSCYKPSHEFIEECIKNELSFINLEHPSLVKIDELMKKVEQEYSDLKKAESSVTVTETKKWSFFGRGSAKVEKVSESSSEKETRDIICAKNIVISYYNIIRKNITDYVIKAIMTFLIGQSVEKIRSELFAKMYKNEMLEFLLFEPPEVQQRRKHIIDMVSRMKKALKLMDEVLIDY